MKRALLLFVLFATLALLDVRPVTADDTITEERQGCSNSALCAVPVAGNGLYSLLFNPLTQVTTSVSLFSPLYDSMSNFTLQAWIYLTPVTLPVPNERPIFFKGLFAQAGHNGVPTSAEFYLYINSNNFVGFRMGGGGTNYGFDFTTPFALGSDVWTQVTVTMNVRTRVASIYVDGALLAAQTWLLASPSAPYTDEVASPRVLGQRIQLGLYSQFQGPVHRFDGRIDEVRVWNRTLSPSEITTNLNKALVGEETGLISYHPMNEGSGSTFSSPWPLTDGRLAPATVPTVSGTIVPADTLVWTSSEVQVNHPNTYYAKRGLPLTAPNLGVAFYLYAIVPLGSTAASNLAYFVQTAPRNGKLYWDGVLIDETYDGSDIRGNRTHPYPELVYIPNDGFTGTDTMEYLSFYRGGDSALTSVTFTSGCRWIDNCNVCEGTAPCEGCLESQKDVCGVCFGNGTSCLGCDNVPNSGKKLDDCLVCGGLNRDKDACGDCFGNGSRCAGCDGVPNSNLTLDACLECGGNNRSMDVCGVCFGNGTSCLGCDNQPQRDPALRRIIDACNVCTLPSEANATCRGCDGKVSFPPKLTDLCGICGGNNTKCLSGCDNLPNSRATFDVCGVCGGNGDSCKGCDGVPQKDPALRAKFDECGVCGGNGSSCADCDGVPNGPNPPDVCGECGGNGTWCLDCLGCPFGDAVRDVCGECNGNGSSCAGCDGVPQPDPALRKVKDLCGTCGGNNSDCSHLWCNQTIPFSKVDACGICNGDNSTCQCTSYRNRTVAMLDCVLLEWTLANAMAAVEEQLSLLADISRGLNMAELGSLNAFVGDQIKQLNSFATECSEVYCSTLSSVLDEIADYVSRSPSTSSRRSAATATDSTSAISRFAALLPQSTH